MTLVSNKVTNKLFLTSNTKINSTLEDLDLILSPEFYWVRIFEIPVKTINQARHVLPTLFEDIIEDTTILTYHVQKLDENKYLCFAYNNKIVYEAIKKANIPNSLINSIYFAQNECIKFNSFEIDSLIFMYTEDKILVKVPKNFLESAMPLNKVIKNINLSSEKLNIKLYNDVLSTKYYFVLFTICFVLITLNAIKYYDFSSNVTKNENLIREIKLASKLPTSSLQTDAILNKYSKIVKSENEKREAISYVISNTKFNLKSFSLEKKYMNLEYMSANKNEVLKYLKKKFKVVKVNEKSFILKVRIEL